MPVKQLMPDKVPVKFVRITYANELYNGYVGDLVALEFFDAKKVSILSMGAFNTKSTTVKEITLLDEERIVGIKYQTNDYCLSHI